MTTAYDKFEKTINWILGVQNKNHKEIEKSKIENYDKKSVFKFDGFSNTFFNKNKQGDGIEKGKPEEQEKIEETIEQKPEEEKTEEQKIEQKTEEVKPEEVKPEEQEKPKDLKNTKKEYDERRKKEYGNKV